MTGELPTRTQLLEELFQLGTFDPDEVDAVAIAYYEIDTIALSKYEEELNDATRED